MVSQTKNNQENWYINPKSTNTPTGAGEEIKMTLEQILVIAATAWVYAKVGGWLVREMKKQERRENAAGRRTA
jgi:hypothetical protein